MALRLTSKSQGIHASATKAFAKRYFTDVLLLWTKYSLENFVKICQHPIFGPSIRRIQLSCARYEENDLEDSVRELLDQGHARSDFVEKIQQLAQRCDHDHEQFPYKRVEALLDQAFSSLAKSNNSFDLAVSADEEKSLGRNKVLGPQMGSAGWWANPHAALGFLLCAADRINLKVRRIEVNVEAPSPCELDGHDFVFHEWKDLDSVRSISELTVNLWVSPRLNMYRHDFGMVQSLLFLAVDLKKLHIRGNIFINMYIEFRPLAELISHLPLEELHLTGLEMDRDIMTDMLKGLGPTLRRLKLAECAIWGAWKQILLCIQQHALQLEELHISGAGRGWLGKTKVYEGADRVRSGVARLLQARGKRRRNLAFADPFAPGTQSELDS